MADLATLAAGQPAPRVSFRDPSGRVVIANGRVLRFVQPGASESLLRFLNSNVFSELSADGVLVRTKVLHSSDDVPPGFGSAGAGTLILEHERVAFPSYPYEWAPEMLHAAGKLTVAAATRALRDGYGLKDATPYNVLFQGAKPVFVDVASFEERVPDDPIWLPYGQFVRTFLTPLLVNKYYRVPIDQILLTRRDGLEPEEAYAYTGTLRKLLPPFLGLVAMPTWLKGRSTASGSELYRSRRCATPDMARFMLERLFKRADRMLDRLAPPLPRSAWSDYVSQNNYDENAAAAKDRIITGVLTELRPKRVLDVGCNTGRFSVMAASAGAEVVAIDYDAAVIGRLWRQASDAGLNILPLVVNATRPTPAVGWANEECLSFLARARGAFDCVLMLAVIHHMLVSERIPLEDILAMAAELTRRDVIIEYVDREDSMFRRLLRGRDALHSDFTQSHFEQACQDRFAIVRREPIEGSHRIIYVLRRRDCLN